MARSPLKAAHKIAARSSDGFSIAIDDCRYAEELFAAELDRIDGIVAALQNRVDGINEARAQNAKVLYRHTGPHP